MGGVCALVTVMATRDIANVEIRNNAIAVCFLSRIFMSFLFS